MSLAWSYQHQTKPDLAAAERNARAALNIVPYWHYVRDILLPQILAARTLPSPAPDSAPAGTQKSENKFALKKAAWCVFISPAWF
jgi:hypothetical protein